MSIVNDLCPVPLIHIIHDATNPLTIIPFNFSGSWSKSSGCNAINSPKSSIEMGKMLIPKTVTYVFDGNSTFDELSRHNHSLLI